MTYLLDCKETGIDCPARIHGDSPEDVMNKALEHGRTVHGLKPEEVSPELQEKMRHAIKEEPSA